MSLTAGKSLPTEILVVANGEAAAAMIYRGVDAAFLRTVNIQWRTAFDDLRQKAGARGVSSNALPRHGHWDWERKERVTRSLNALFLAVECEGEAQGLMMLTFHKTYRLPSQSGAPMVYVDYLESAPWNIEPLADAPRYRAVGSVLLEQAILLSEEQGFEGRIDLHSLAQAERFYTRKMTDLGIDPTVEYLRYFEMTPQQAAQFMGR